MLHRLIRTQFASQPIQRTARWLRQHNLASALSSGWREHGLPLAFYLLLSVALMWPTPLHFATRIIGGGPDALHNLWLFWHTQQAVVGNQPWFFTPLLYYPQGASLLTHGLGPVTGLFSVPFWIGGPAAGHNGAILVSLWLTGYCMYLLARGLRFERDVSLFAGLVLMTAPICTAGLLGNVTKVFLGGIPLVLLAIHHALDLKRSLWWGIAVAVALLVPLLHSGYQFIFAVLGVAFFAAASLITAKRHQYWPLLKRYGVIGLSALLLIGPFVIATLIASSSYGIKVDLSTQSGFEKHQPDLMQFLLPYARSRLFGETSQQLQAHYDVIPSIDKAVALSWTGIALCLVALGWGQYPARRWLLFTLVFIVLALGPFLRAFGQSEFTEYDLELVLPYAFLSGIPGFDFMRFPGRFMMIGYVGFWVTASFGLAFLLQRFPRQRISLMIGVVALVLLETWPTPVYTSSLPPIPAFYEQIVDDQEQYGIFNLPINPNPEVGSYVIPSSLYQVYQTTHHKGIAAGYLSRTYDQHPHFPYLMEDYVDLGQDNLYVNNEPAGRVMAHNDLARYNYRYVVWHKTNGGRDGAGNRAAEMFIDAVFGGQTPLVDDDLVQVFEVPQQQRTLLQTGNNWRRAEAKWHWVASPATLTVTVPQPQPVLLELIPAAIHDPQSANGLGERGLLDIRVGDTFSTSVDIGVDRMTTVPLVLPNSTETITLSLRAGNFQPATYGSTDTATLSFALRSINLVTPDNADRTAEILMNDAPQQSNQSGIVALRGAGWYAPSNARWAQSPAELLVYSPQAQQAQLELTPALLYDPSRADGLGEQGAMQVTVNGNTGEEVSVQVGQPATLPIALDAGWNMVQLELVAGNFRPSDVQPGNGDQRLLSFAFTRINVATK